MSAAKPRLSRRARRTLLVVHIIAGVAVLGDVWGLALMHITALNSGSHVVGSTAFRFTTVLVFAGGVPFSVLSLLTGLVLAIWGGWGLRQLWILLKLGLQLSILATGALFIRPLLARAPATPDLTAEHRLFLVLLAVQGTMLLAATALAVGKPGSRRRKTRAATP